MLRIIVCHYILQKSLIYSLVYFVLRYTENINTKVTGYHAWLCLPFADLFPVPFPDPKGRLDGSPSPVSELSSLAFFHRLSFATDESS